MNGGISQMTPLIRFSTALRAKPVLPTRMFRTAEEARHDARSGDRFESFPNWIAVSLATLNSAEAVALI